MYIRLTVLYCVLSMSLTMILCIWVSDSKCSHIFIENTSGWGTVCLFLFIIPFRRNTVVFQIDVTPVTQCNHYMDKGLIYSTHFSRRWLEIRNIFAIFICQFIADPVGVFSLDTSKYRINSFNILYTCILTRDKQQELKGNDQNKHVSLTYLV